VLAAGLQSHLPPDGPSLSIVLLQANKAGFPFFDRVVVSFDTSFYGGLSFPSLVGFHPY